MYTDLQVSHNKSVSQHVPGSAGISSLNLYLFARNPPDSIKLDLRQFVTSHCLGLRKRNKLCNC